MNAKKALAVLMVAVMLLVPFTFAVSAADVSIVSGPIKTAYTDNEYFNPQGLVITVDGKEIAYSPIDDNFKFVPGLDEKLTVDKGIDVYYTVVIDDETVTDVKVGTITVNVAHVWGPTTYMDNTHHGKFCLGCGIVDETTFGEHDVAEYIPNDDGGLFTQQTETGICSECQSNVTRSIPGTEKFKNLFTDNQTETESLIVYIFETVIVSLVQMIVGIGNK